ncbi:hypothetical protein Fcan01_20519 [Folsomia candida]|uniref:Ionotropic glutamate receptor C-terminal domain-containing protein n=1 Tax=Folsomia candida TaxID=158441 RepID=A0A226DIL0_FOLCA|nr:hypothetical protein Fcan01_20519 [Folsomia candida]
MNKSEVTSFLVWISTEISIVSGRKLAIFSNFGNKYNFCISSRHANSLGFLLCKRGLNHGYTEGIVSLFQELSTPPKWKFMVLDEHSILIDDLYKVSAAASNPFITSVPINYHLIQILLYKENVSYAREEDPYATASWKPVEVAAYDSSPLIVTYLGWKFLTCYSNTYLSFSFYTAPFQVEVWCGIFVTVATLILVLVLFQKYDDSDDTSYLSPWLFILANMLEESGSIPRSMEKKAFYRYTLGSWVLMSVILTNCYNGLMITSLNAPLPGVNLKGWMERYGIKNYLDHWTSTDIAVLYAPISSSIRMKNQSLTCFRLMSPPIVLYGRASIQFVWALVHMALRFKREQDQIGSISRQTLVTLALMNPKHSMEPSEQFYTNNSEVMASINNFKELGQCGKSVYIAKSSEIAATLDFLDKKFYGVKFNVGSDVLMDELYGWVFDDQGYSKIPTYLKYLLEGGILGRMMAEEQRRTFVAVSTLLPPKFRDRVNKMAFPKPESSYPRISVQFPPEHEDRSSNPVMRLSTKDALVNPSAGAPFTLKDKLKQIASPKSMNLSIVN